VSVSVAQLTKRFDSGQAPAVENVSFDAPSGKITALLGPSGSGKSTLLRLIAGLEEPDAGAVTIAGANVTRVPARERGVGFVFQGYALFRHMNVRDNIAFGLSIRGDARAEIDRRVAKLLSLIQLEGYERRLPHQLSGGQRQRVALARALATEPKVLLLDEPFGALDARVRMELREWLAAFHEKTGVTTILVTHDQDEALELAENVVLLCEGRVVQSGAPNDLYDRPKTPFVATFLGGANVLRGGDANVTYVRPHDVRILRAAEHDERANGANETAVVERLARVGGRVKLALRLATGEAIAVELARGEVEPLALAIGDRVTVELQRMTTENVSVQ
jgi:sulfate transport system ATP-binding protein